MSFNPNKWFSGRLSQGSFTVGLVATILAFYILNYIINYLRDNFLLIMLSWVAYLLLILTFIFILSLTVRRLHDIGISGYWILVLFLVGGGPWFFGGPGVYVAPILGLLLILMPGESKSNRFGQSSSGRIRNQLF